MAKKFKFEIIRKKSIETCERFLAYFLGDTAEEAEKLYHTFSKILNTISNNYSAVTGIDKFVIFSEALIGLARARRDFDPDKSDNFKGYVIFHVKNAINIYIKKNRSIVSVPVYLRNANRHLNKMRNGCDESAKLFKKIAERAKISVKTLVERVESIPLDIEYKEWYTDDNRKEETIYTTLEIEKLKKYMREDELKITELIMKGKTYREIGKIFDKTASWVVYKLKKVGDRIIEKDNDQWEK